jgi:GPH family glycoside/pentoside/hexuronide:cation symporter
MSLPGLSKSAQRGFRDGERVGAGRLLAFSLITLPLAGAGLPLAVYLPAFYAQQAGLGLTVVGLVFMLGRFWDAAADPLIGVLSDQTSTRFGRRRPWIAVGGLLFGLASLALFAPPAHIAWPYLAAALFVFYLGWTMIQIPLSACWA